MKDIFAEGILLGISSLGIIFDKWEENVIYISVPRYSTDYGPDGQPPLAGKALADRFQTRLKDMGASNLQVKYRIREETWTKRDRERIMKE
jgi:hypothetical protein